jgi:DNA-binding NarL/FixJ family response regulator
VLGRRLSGEQSRSPTQQRGDEGACRWRRNAELEPDVEIVGEAANGTEALAPARALRPDVVLMDLRMPEMDGVEATSAISAELPQVHVLVLTTYDTDCAIVRAVGARASGYLLKDAPLADLADAVRAAGRGETVLAPPVAARLVRHVREPTAESLTAWEVHVLGPVAEGMTNAGIDRALFISEATVKTRLLGAAARLGVDDPTRAVLVANDHGLLQSAESAP